MSTFQICKGDGRKIANKNEGEKKGAQRGRKRKKSKGEGI